MTKVIKVYTKITNDNFIICTRMQDDQLTEILEGMEIPGFCGIGNNNQQIDRQLAQAVQDVLTSGKLTPLIKEELKTKIQAERMKTGKDELIVVFETAKTFELREDEKERIVKRKEANRLAAIRFRRKRKGREMDLCEECDHLERANEKLTKELNHLEEEKSQLLEAISTIRSPP